MEDNDNATVICEPVDEFDTSSEVAEACEESVGDGGGLRRRNSAVGSVTQDYDRRAALARMTSRRDVIPSVSASSESRGRQRSTTTASNTVTEAGEQTDKVLDFFRQVNKDAHVLSRMSSDGVHGCCSKLLRGITRCVRGVGLGNPGVAVGDIDFVRDTTVDKTNDHRWHTASGRRLSVTNEDVIAQLEEEEEENVSEELYEQKRKVSELGELPALSWKYVTRNLMVCLVLIAILLALEISLTTCVQVTDRLCLIDWCYPVSIAIAALFLIEILAKGVSSFLKWTLLLHTSNNAWIFIRLHKEISLMLWSIMIFCLLAWFKSTDYAFDGSDIVWRLLACFMTYCIIKVIREICNVEMAHQYMWTPYLERARTSIWSQYVIFMLTDFAMGVPNKDSEGQALALSFSRSRNIGEKMSLYTVGKAIGFVHANALKHPLGAGQPGTDAEGIIDSKTGAKLFGGLLFDALMVTYNDMLKEEMILSPLTKEARAAVDAFRSAHTKKRSGSGEAALPRPHEGSDGQRYPHRRGSTSNGSASSSSSSGGRHSGGANISNHLTRKLSPVGEGTEPSYQAMDSIEEEKRAPDESTPPTPTDTSPASKAVSPPPLPSLNSETTHIYDSSENLAQARRERSAQQETAPAEPSTATPRAEELPVKSQSQRLQGKSPATAAQPATASADTVPLSKTSLPTPIESSSLEAGDGDKTRDAPTRTSVVSAAKHWRKFAAGSGPGRKAGGHYRGKTSQVIRQEGINLALLRRMTNKTLALKIMQLFEVHPDDVISRKVFVDFMVAVFVQRRSLQLTLGDYEAILKKVSYMFNILAWVIVFFVSLRILGYNVGNLVLTWLSLAVAFSFLFGSSASAFFESVIFIFVTKAYDVGDPVFFVDDRSVEDWYIVTRINMLTTVFRRWDGECTLISNSIMATKLIRNQWRSGSLLHNTMIAVAADTPRERLEEMKLGIVEGLRNGHHSSGIGGMMPDTVDHQIKGLTDGNRLAVFVMCRQKTNGANMGRRFGNDSLFIELIARECTRLGINYTMPLQPVTVKHGLDVLRERESFLSGERETGNAGGGQGASRGMTRGIGPSS